MRSQPKKRRRAPEWSSEDKAELLRLRQVLKLPRAECASRLGRTKNAIIGQLDRLLRQGVPVTRDRPGGNNNPLGRNQHKPAPPVAKNNNPHGWSGVPKRLAAPPRPPLKPKDGSRYVPSLSVVRPVAAPVALMKLHRRACRYIGERPELLTLDTRIYCGALTDGGSWCPEHKARCVVLVRRT